MTIDDIRVARCLAVALTLYAASRADPANTVNHKRALLEVGGIDPYYDLDDEEIIALVVELRCVGLAS